METVRRVLERDAFAAHCGIELVDLAPGRARVRMDARPFHANAFGMVHGGAIFTLADCAFQAACNSHGTLAVAVEAGISFFRPPSSETIFAEAEEINCSRSLGTYAIRVTDEEGRLLAQFQGTAFRKGTPHAAPTEE